MKAATAYRASMLSEPFQRSNCFVNTIHNNHQAATPLIKKLLLCRRQRPMGRRLLSILHFHQNRMPAEPYQQIGQPTALSHHPNGRTNSSQCIHDLALVVVYSGGASHR